MAQRNRSYTIALHPELADAIDRYAKEQRIPVGTAIAEILRAYLMAEAA